MSSSLKDLIAHKGDQKLKNSRKFNSCCCSIVLSFWAILSIEKPLDPLGPNRSKKLKETWMDTCCSKWAYLKILLQKWVCARCLKITEKVSFNIVSEASYVYILSGQKFIQNAENRSILASFWQPEACGQTVLPDRSVLIGQKMVENAKIQKFKCDILSNFQTVCKGTKMAIT